MASWQIAVRSEKKYHENTRRKCAEKAVEKEPDTTRVCAAIAIQMQTRQMSVKVARNLHTNLNHFVEPLSASVSARVSASVSASVVCLCVRITRANNISHINSHFNQFACNLRGWHNPRSSPPLFLATRSPFGCPLRRLRCADSHAVQRPRRHCQPAAHPLFPFAPWQAAAGVARMLFVFVFATAARTFAYLSDASE